MFLIIAAPAANKKAHCFRSGLLTQLAAFTAEASLR